MNHKVMPKARTIGIKYEISSSFFVLYPLTSWGIKPIDVTAPANNPNNSNEVESMGHIAHLLVRIKTFQKCKIGFCMKYNMHTLSLGP